MRQPFFAEIIKQHGASISRSGWKQLYAYCGGKIAGSIDSYKNADSDEVTWIGVKGNYGTYNAPADVNLFRIVNGKIIVDWDKMKEKVDKWNEEIDKSGIYGEGK